MEYYTPAQVAERYQVKVNTVWEWIRKGKLNALDMGGSYRISISDIEKFEEDKRRC